MDQNDIFNDQIADLLSHPGLKVALISHGEGRYRCQISPPNESNVPTITRDGDSMAQALTFAYAAYLAAVGMDLAIKSFALGLVREPIAR